MKDVITKKVHVENRLLCCYFICLFE